MQNHGKYVTELATKDSTKGLFSVVIDVSMNKVMKPNLVESMSLKIKTGADRRG